MDADYKALGFWLQVANSVAVLAVGVYSWLTNRHKANAKAIHQLRDALSITITEIEGRVIRIESDIKHMPTHNDIGQVYDRINEVAETLSQLSGQMLQLNTNTNLIHQHLLNQGTKR